MLKRRGERAEATIVRAEPLHSNHESAIVPYRLRLRIDGESTPGREVEIKATARREQLIGRGVKLVVLTNPRDPEAVAIDWDASNELLAAGGVPGLESTELGRALGGVIAAGGDVTEAQIDSILAAAQRDPGQSPSIQTDLAGELTRLAELHAAGSLSDEEFAAAKRRLLEG